nr:hypothetical protein [uncultured Shinella sp.]
MTEARLAAREILAEDLRKGQVDETRLFEIFNERGELVARLPFKDAIS